MADTLDFNEAALPPEQRWENLGLSNDFLFGKVMQDVGLCRELIHRILPDLDIGRVCLAEAQRAFQEGIDTRGVRLDIYAKSDEGKVYDIEMQAVNRGNLPKRARGYHILLGLDAMNKDTMRTYNDLPTAFVIFICPFDPFGRGRHIYTFCNICRQDKDLELADETFVIFLNAKGTMEDVSPELKAFLDLVMGRTSEDPFVKSIERALERAKRNSEWRREYMMMFMRDLEKIEEGRAEGLRQGMRQGLSQGRVEGLDAAAAYLRGTGMPPEQIARFRASVLESLRHTHG